MCNAGVWTGWHHLSSHNRSISVKLQSPSSLHIIPSQRVSCGSAISALPTIPIHTWWPKLAFSPLRYMCGNVIRRWPQHLQSEPHEQKTLLVKINVWFKLLVSIAMNSHHAASIMFIITHFGPFWLLSNPDPRNSFRTDILWSPDVPGVRKKLTQEIVNKILAFSRISVIFTQYYPKAWSNIQWNF